MRQVLRVFLILGGVMVLILLIGTFISQHHSDYHWGNAHMMGYSSWGWIMTVLMIFFWGLLIWAIVTLFRHISPGADNNSAIEILKRRYATGEIGRAEYEKIKRELTG